MKSKNSGFMAHRLRFGSKTLGRSINFLSNNPQNNYLEIHSIIHNPKSKFYPKDHRTLGSSKGFTIVELLVVIVVIGVLAAITMVSFGSVQRRAVIASLQSDLKNSSIQLGIDYSENNDTYPISEAAANGNMGLKKSFTTSYNYIKTGNDYCLSASYINDSSLVFRISSGDNIIQEGSCPHTWKQISTGAYHACGISYDNNVYCWGYNYYGQLGNNSADDSHIPVQVDQSGALSGKTIKSLSLGFDHSCAIASDDLVYCWGRNSGMLGDNTESTYSRVPVQLYSSGYLSGKTVLSIAMGEFHGCALASDGKVYCWGANTNGQLGDNKTSSNSHVHVPVPVDMTGVLNNKTVKTISANEQHTCVIASDYQGYCWGRNYFGQHGDGNAYGDNLVPVAVSTSGVLSGKTLKSLIAGQYHTCAVASDDMAYCWGSNSYGELGDNMVSGNESHVPVAVKMTGTILQGKTIKSIMPGSNHTCAIASDDLAYCWGLSNSYGMLGNNSTGQSLSPVQVDRSTHLNNKTIKTISGVMMTDCIIASDSQGYCWGANWYGGVGNNSTTNSIVPSLVIF